MRLCGMSETPIGEPHLNVLTPDECRGLLASQAVGRLGVVRGGYPLIFPVNYIMHNERVVLRTDEGAKLQAARYHRVSFEIDEFDSKSLCGWSVLIQGFATELTEGDPLYREYRALTLRPWAPGERNRILVVTPVSVTGRRIAEPVSD